MKKLNGLDLGRWIWRVSEVSVKYQSKANIADRPINSGSQSAAEIFRENWNDNMVLVEEFNVLFLNRSNIGYKFKINIANIPI